MNTGKAQEELHPELAKAIVKIKDIEYIRHPLIVTIYAPEITEEINNHYAKKMAKISSSQPPQYLHLIERPYRLQTLAAWWKSKVFTDVAELKEALCYAWPDTESDDTTNSRVIREVINMFKQSGFCTDHSDENEARPTEKLTIYRGGLPNGIAWSTDNKVAEWFAKRFQDNEPEPIYKATVEPEHVLARFFKRNEHEVVIDPKHAINPTRIH